MIEQYKNYQNEFNFIIKDLLTIDKNVFTVLVGKNGTGKSRLLNSIILKLIGDDPAIKRYMRRYSGVDLNEIENSDLRFDCMPSNIITISVSPFDKFPLLPLVNRKKLEVEDYYYYLGLRQLRSTDLGKEYMSNIFLSLLFSIDEDFNKITKIMKVLTYLGYEEGIQIQYKPITSNILNRILDSQTPEEDFIKMILERRMSSSIIRVNRSFFETDREKKVCHLINILYKYRDLLYKSIDLFLSEQGVDIDYGSIVFDSDFLFLLETGILSVDDIVIKKRNISEPFTIREASSGEQSVVVSMLGITSRIQDNSLICIDEPEICLHPEWQEKYIDFLIHTFRDFKNCHFLIATHSPLIVSKLEDENCFVMSMENGSIKSASEVNKRSVDFQLANTFKTPGFKNEYLMRELLTFLTDQSSSLENIDDSHIQEFLKLEDSLDDKDPVKNLLQMVNETIKVKNNA